MLGGHIPLVWLKRLLLGSPGTGRGWSAASSAAMSRHAGRVGVAGGSSPTLGPLLESETGGYVALGG